MDKAIIEQLATRLISFGIAIVKLTVTTKTVSLAFTYNNLKVELEVEREVIDAGMDDLRDLSDKLVEYVKGMILDGK